MSYQQEIPPVLAEVRDERRRQDQKWGEQNHPNGVLGAELDCVVAQMAKSRCQANHPHEDNWRAILSEEIGEAFAAQNDEELRAELVQVAAVSVAWIEAIDRRPATPPEVGSMSPDSLAIVAQATRTHIDVDPVTDWQDSPRFKAAAWSGIASNEAMDVKERLAAALEALALYETALNDD